MNSEDMTIAWFDAMGRRVRDRVRREAVRRIGSARLYAIRDLPEA